MLGLGWLTVRQAQEALRQGRLEEAHRLLAQSTLSGNRQAVELRLQLARVLVERGKAALQKEDAVRAWQDLLLAEQLEVSDASGAEMRQALTRLGLAEVRALLEAGEPQRALETITRLHEKHVRHAELGAAEEAARAWVQGRELAEHGSFGQAALQLERVRRLGPRHLANLEKDFEVFQDRDRIFPGLLGDLHTAAQHKNWRDV